MTTETQVTDLRINKLTKDQYDSITPSETELYFVTDDITEISAEDVIDALGYTPYDASNPDGFVDSSVISSYALKAPDINVLSTSGAIALTDNSVNSITPVGNIVFVLPTVTDNTKYHRILVQMNLTSAYSIDVGTDCYFDGIVPDLSKVGIYNIFYEYDRAREEWVARASEKINPFEVASVTCSYYTTWYLTKNGDLYGCGYNDKGQQGSGDTNNVLTFTKRASNVAFVTCGRDATWYITNDGDLYGCGSNFYGQQGSGTSGSGTDVTTFTKRASNVKLVVYNYATTWYLTNDGELYGCGQNEHGQQGSGTSGDVITTFTKRAENVLKIFQCIGTGGTSWYIATNGDLYGCGLNGSGQQGSGDTTDVTTFTKRASNVKLVACESNVTWYVTNDGELYGCGYNSSGQQGSGDTAIVTTFTKRASNVASAACSEISSWYLTNDGDLYGCGQNGNGQQGSGDTTFSFKTFIKRASNVAFIICSSGTTWYLSNTGDLYGCGFNGAGQQGSGDTTDVLTFTKRAEDVVEASASGGTTWYMNTSGELYGCGANYYGAQGSGGTVNVTTFTKRN